MSHPILVTGTAGGRQGSTGRVRWTFRRSEERYQSTGAIRMVTGRNLQNARRVLPRKPRILRRHYSGGLKCHR